MPGLKKLSVFALFAMFLLAGCGLSLAEDITPPPNYRPPTVVPNQPVQMKTVFPILPPDPAQGEAIYAAKCLACHGERGMGDGPQAADLPNPAAPIGSPELARASRPVDWYQMVTQGNMERFMPPFSSLTDRERWDVVAYTYTLSTDPEDLAEGQALYQANCADCHGLTGQGDGPQAASLATRPSSWTDQSLLAQLSANEMVDWMMQGRGEMPAFQDVLDQNQAYAVASYIRTLSFAPSGQPVEVAAAEEQPAEEQPAVTPEAGSTPQVEPDPGTEQAAQEPAENSTITINGTVTNATPGGSVPEGLTVELAAFVGMAPAFEETAPVNADGSYTFEDVAYQNDYVYFARVEANGLFFNSDILHGADVQGQQVDLPLEIYETTSDPTVLRSDRLHVFFDFTTPGKVQVVNLYIISNPSGRVVVATEPDQPVVRFDLPEGYANLQFQDGQLGERYVQTETGFGDTAAVPPGQAGMNQILFAYDLPYTNSLTYSMELPLPVESAVVMLPASGVSMSSDQLQDAGQRDLEGMSFRMFQADSSLAAGETIELSLRGTPNMGGTGAQAEDSMTYMLIGLGVFGVVLAGAGFWLLRQRAREQMVAEGEAELVLEDEAGESSESILDAIVALDDQHATGGLPEEAYQQRRAELKASLAEALEREKGE